MATGKLNCGSKLIGNYHLQIGNVEHRQSQGFPQRRNPRCRFTIRVGSPWKLIGDKPGLEIVEPAS